MSYTNHLFDAIDQMASEFGDEPPTSVKVVVALSLLCQTEIEILEAAKQKAAERIEAAKPNVAKKRGRKRKVCLYSGEPLTGKQTKFASQKYAQAYWRENNREKIRAAYRKWYQKKKKDA